MLPSLRAALQEELAELEARGRLRSLPALAGASRVNALLANQPILNFSSNDYLGLGHDPRIAEAAALASLHSGFGAAASRLVSGDLPAHRDFEAALARFLRAPAALLFPSGYQTNLGVITTLAGPRDLIVSDALNHASLIDGCRLSRATVRVFPHSDPAAARSALTDSDARAARRRFLVTETVFSMDGDVAPVGALAEVALATNTALIIDEAHALACLGPRGRGICAEAGVSPDVLVGTLGKALASAGGFAAGAPELRRILENRARSFLFTTASPPCLPAAATAALAIADAAEGDDRRERLAANIDRLRVRLDDLCALSPGTPLTPIVPIVLGDDRRAVAASQALRERGFFVQAIRPPTVPEGTARLRVTLSAAHSLEQVDALATVLRQQLA